MDVKRQMAGLGNAAYDFSRFEAREVQLAEIVDITEHLEEKKPRYTLRYIARVVLAFAVIGLMVGPLIYNEVQINELNMQISRSERQLSEAVNEYIQIEMIAESRVSTEEVEYYATNVLGMKKVQPEQIIYISVNSGDKVEVTAEPDTNLFEKIAQWFSGIFS